MSMLNLKSLFSVMLVFNALGGKPDYPEKFHLVFNGKDIDVIAPGFEKATSVKDLVVESVTQARKIDKILNPNSKVNFNELDAWVLNQKERIFNGLQDFAFCQMESKSLEFIVGYIKKGFDVFQEHFPFLKSGRNNFNIFLYSSFSSSIDVLQNFSIQYIPNIQENMIRQYFYMSFILLLEEVYLNRSEDVYIYKKLFLTLSGKDKMLEPLPGIQYTSNFDHAESDFLRIFCAEYDSAIKKFSDNWLKNEEVKKKELQAERRKQIAENVARALAKADAAEKAEKEKALLPAAAPDDEEEGDWDQGKGDWSVKGKQRTGPALEPNVELETEEDKNFQEESPKGFVVAYRNEEALADFSFLRSENEELKDKFIAFLNFNDSKEVDKLLGFIVQILEIIETKSTEKANVLENSIIGVFGSHAFSKGSARHYKKDFNGKSVSCILHEDHAGAQGWQTSAFIASVGFLGKLNFNFQEYLKAA